MRKVLYLVGKNPSQLSQSLLKASSPNQDTSVVLTQEAGTSFQVPAAHVYALSEDAVSKSMTPSFPTVSHQDVLRMIFENDAVVVL